MQKPTKKKIEKAKEKKRAIADRMQISLQVGRLQRAEEKKKGKERIQAFEGVVISKHLACNKIDSTITVRKMFQGGGTEKVFVLNSPWVKSIEILGNSKLSLISVLLLESIFFYNFTTPEFNVNVSQLPFWAMTVYFFWKGLQTNRKTFWFLFGICLYHLNLLQQKYLFPSFFFEF